MAVLQEAREAAGISQRKMSTLLERPKNYCSLVETGQRMLNSSELLAYMRISQADPVALWAEIVRRAPKHESPTGKTVLEGRRKRRR